MVCLVKCSLCFLNIFAHLYLLLCITNNFFRWAYFNYWNDDYYAQWYHQMFFTSTELVSSCIVLKLVDINVPVTSRKASAIVGIAILHVVAGCVDQFILNVIRGEGHMHQVLLFISIYYSYLPLTRNISNYYIANRYLCYILDYFN